MSKKFIRRFLVAFAALSCFVSITFGQEASKQVGCSVIDTAKPPLYVSLATEQDRFREHGQVGLVLHNNTGCPIVVEVYEGNPVPDAAGIFYDVQERRGRSAPAPGNYRRCADCWEDLRIVDKIAGGRSVAFGVRKNYARRRLTISVPFIYEWDIPTSYMERTSHRVYFPGSDWPKKLP